VYDTHLHKDIRTHARTYARCMLGHTA